MNKGIDQEVDALLVRESEMAERVKAFDWSATSLGNPTTWPQNLRVALGICLNSRFPMFVWWGPELINIYNDGYAPLLGQRHPHALGRPAYDVWGEIWPVLEPQVDAVMVEGEASWNERVLLMVERNGFEEEAWFTWSYSPIPDGAGGVGGLFCAVTEDTSEVTAERERDTFSRELKAAQDRIEATLLAAEVGTWDLDIQRDLVLADANLARLFGLPFEKVEKGVPLEIFISQCHPEDQDKVRQSLQAAFESNESKWQSQHRVLQFDGSWRWVNAQGQIERDRDGKALRMPGILVDITEQKWSEVALMAEKKVLEQIATNEPLGTVLETLIQGIEARSTNGMICSVLVSDEAEQVLEFGAAPSLPEAYNQAIHGLRISPGNGSCGSAAFERGPVIVEDIATNPLWANYRELAAQHGLKACSSFAILSSEGRLLGTIAIYYRTKQAPSTRDMELIESARHFTGIVVERKRAEKKVRDALEAERNARSEAERVSQMKDEFLATLSHELRTPLNAILGWASLLSSGRISEADSLQAAETIERNARAQKQLIEDLLDMSRIISGKVRLDVQRVDLADVVSAAVESALPTATAKGVRIEKIIDPYTGLVSGDPSRLQQVIWNLLSNAIKFTPRDGKIQVTLERVNSHLEICVSDTGAGIKPEFLPHVFDRFAQADGTTTRRHGGLGLGLSIVKQIVEMHNGTVRAKSHGEGQGSTFIVALPMAIAQHDSGENRQHPQGGPSPEAPIDLMPSLENLKSSLSMTNRTPAI
jgi:PAS domain S-box-containing protein